ncbi:BamA/TamA family outer membrane protein [Echinicola sediminis]
MPKNRLSLRLLLLAAIFLLKGPDVHGQSDTTGLHYRFFNTVDKALGLLSTETWSFIPAVTYSPETSLGIGAGAIKVFKMENAEEQHLRPSSMPITFVYTLKKQAILEIDLDLWKNYNKDYVNARLELTKYPFQFYGIGNDLPAANQEDYASRYVYFHLNYMRKVLPHVYLGPRVMFRADKVYEKEGDGQLSSGDIPGSDTPVVLGTGLQLNYDSRDDIFQPRRGFYNQLSWMTFKGLFGNAYSYNRYELDIRKYFPVGKDNVIAVHSWWSFIDGEAPFQQLSLLGGSKRMRGYFEGRYRDKLAMVHQAEWRFPVYGNLGMVLFGSTGQVANRFSQYALERFHYGAGFGFRYKLMDEGINIRIDFGFGDQKAFYFGLNEVI